MRVLVTGGTGFTGTALVRRLREANHDVVALDYKDGLHCDALREIGAEVVIGSVTDRAVVERSMQGVEFVFHLAAAFRELNVPHSFYDEVNVEGTRNVVEAALRAGVWKFVYCSTCGVHGNVDHPPAGEDAPDSARGLLPADQVRGRAAGEAAGRREDGDRDPETRRHLRSRAIPNASS